jgi:hypothetical protein
MKKMFILAAACMWLFACNNEEKKEEPKTNENTMSADGDKDKKQQPAEFADAKYAEWGKKWITQLSSGDMDGWISSYADNAKFRWSSGDSLSGKDEILKYWTDRRKNVIDSISFSNDIWLPVKINTPQTAYDVPGVWLLSWYMVNVKYKNGKKLMFWVHTDHHYNANDKIDQSLQYIDRAPINKALGVK